MFGVANLKTVYKLGLGFGLLLFSLGMMGVLAIGQASHMDQASDAIVRETIPINNAARDMLLQMVNMETGVRGFMVTGLEKTLSAYTNAQPAIAHDLDYLAAHYPKDSSLRDLVENRARPQIQGLQATFGN